MKAESNLEKILAAKEFAVTAEYLPPRSADAETVRLTSKAFKGKVDALVVRDGQVGVVAMSGMAASMILLHEGIEPILELVCRDRNRIAIQGDVLGAVAQGIRNVLCVSGAHPSVGATAETMGHPSAKGVYDLDSIQLIGVLRALRDEKRTQGGDPIAGDLPLLIGSTAAPFTQPLGVRVFRLAKKVNAGADFILTQAVLDAGKFAAWMEDVRARKLHEECAILAGIAAADNAAAATIKAVRKIEGVRGVHLIGPETRTLHLVEEARLLPRPGAGKKNG